MARILVAGNINHDRVWHLDRPLVAGGRLTCLSREVRLGGGAYHTGAQLLRLGHAVTIAGTLMDDETGRAALTTLQAMGFGTGHVRLIAGETAPADILLDPTGERTIIAPPGRQRPPVDLAGPTEADALYVNATAVAPALFEAMRAAPLTVAQYPAKGSARPAHVLIGSAADLGTPKPATLWAEAERIAGSALSRLVVTDGPDPVRLFDGLNVREVPPPHRLPLTDTIGAGDIFAGSYLHALVTGLADEAAILCACRLTEERLAERLSHSPA